MSRPSVTVLMALYNGGEYLRQTVHSVLTQTYDSFEFLIINDCSTDNSLEIIESFRDERIKVYTNPRNVGQTPSLNVGLKLAKGDYFARIDGDDIALPRWLQTQIDAAEQYPDYSVISSHAVAIDEKNRVKKIYRPPSDREDIILRSLFAPPIHHVGSILKKEDIVEVGGYDDRYIYAADYDLWERLIRKGFRITTTPRVLVAIREHGKSVSRSEHGRRDLAEIKEIAGRNIERFINGQFSREEVSLFCRANYDEGNLTEDEFSGAMAVTRKVYMNLVPSLRIKRSQMRTWTRQRCMIISLKRVFFLIRREDYSAVRNFCVRAMREFGALNPFAVIWSASLFGGMILNFMTGVYHGLLRQKSCLQLGRSNLSSFGGGNASIGK